MSGNGLPLWQNFLLMWGDTLLGHLSVLIFVYTLMEEGSIRRRLKKLPPLLLFSPGACAVFMWVSLGRIPSLPRLFIGSAQNIIVITLWCMWAWRTTFWRCLPAIGLAGLLQIFTSTLGNSLLGFLLLALKLQNESPGLRLLLVSPVLLLDLGICRALKKLAFGEKFRLLLRSGGHLKSTSLLIIFLDAVLVFFFHLQKGMGSLDLPSYFLLTMVLGGLALVPIFYLVQRNVDQSQLQAQQDIIVQQQLYEQSLEELRQEMREFRHDYKNLLASFAGEWESSELGQSLKELEVGLDRRLGEKIQVSVHMGNLRIPQVRSLLLTKLAKMREQGIECKLEVLYPVIRLGMERWDFVRCLGILVDNALEAAQETEKPWVEILLLQQEDSLMVRVANPWKKGADMGRIWDEGYSTKGYGRGLGLASYRRILRAYPNISNATSWEEGEFVQELAIALAHQT
ncbi:MAG: GHKL domain-containing protein [Lachnospiraceae bacterium]|nr:GHKL domain-containing protein [Lachnospiraceae bacterium]